MAMVKLYRKETKREQIAPGVYGPVDHLHAIGHFSVPKGHELAAKEHKPKKGEHGTFDLTDDEIAHARACGITVMPA